PFVRAARGLAVPAARADGVSPTATPARRGAGDVRDDRGGVAPRRARGGSAPPPRGTAADGAAAPTGVRGDSIRPIGPPGVPASPGAGVTRRAAGGGARRRGATGRDAVVSARVVRLGRLRAAVRQS